MKIKSITLMFILIIPLSHVLAQVDESNYNENSFFSVDAEFRNRTEYSPSFDSTGNARYKMVQKGTNSAVTSWQRSRIILRYKTKKIETKFSLQDVRPFGQNDKSFLSNNGQSLSVHEAWAKYYFINNENRQFGVKFGRQEVFNQDGRLIWYKNWNNYGAAHDAIMLECNNKQLNAAWELGFSINSFNGIGYAQLPKYRHLAYLNFKKKFGKLFTIHFTDLFTTQENSTISYAIYGKNTVGINPILKIGEFTFNGSFYYQFGATLNSGTSQKVEAFLYSGNVWYKFGTFNLGIGHDGYSGDSDFTDETSKAFRTFCCGAHLFFGNTDFHVPLLKKNKGLKDFNLKVKGSLNEKTDIYAAFHMISFQQMNIYINDVSEEIEFKTVGNTSDIVLSRILAPHMEVKMGYSVMLPSEDFVNYHLGYGTDAKFHNWGWLMFTFKPSFLKVEK